MFIDKAAIVQALEELGEYDLADDARVVLPDQVDSEQHLELLLRFGIDPRDLLGHLRRPPPASGASAAQRAVRHRFPEMGSRDRPRRERSSS